MMALELEMADLDGLLSDNLSSVKESASVRHLHIEIDTEQSIGLLPLDRQKTMLIVHNLLANAVKYSVHGGRITLSTRRVSRAAVGVLPGAWPVCSFPLVDSKYNKFIQISVDDRGIGIARKNLEKLFQVFGQRDSTGARESASTNLGLAMVKQLTELHGGSVAVASLEGKGTCFTVWLPLRDSAFVTAAAHDTGISTMAAEPAKRRSALQVQM